MLFDIDLDGRPEKRSKETDLKTLTINKRNKKKTHTKAYYKIK